MITREEFISFSGVAVGSLLVFLMEGHHMAEAEEVLSPRLRLEREYGEAFEDIPLSARIESGCYSDCWDDLLRDLFTTVRCRLSVSRKAKTAFKH